VDRYGGVLHHRSVVSFPLKPRQVSGLIADSASRWNSHNAPRLGAALAFYTLLSVAPLLGVLATIGSLFFGSERTRAEIVRQVYSVAGPAGAKVVSSILGIAPGAQHGILAAVSGILILFFGASAVLIELREALNLMWDIPVSTRTPLEDVVQLVRERLFAFVVVLLIGFFLLVSMTVDVIASALVHTVSRLPVQALHLGASAVSFVVITGLFAVIFRFIPDLRLEWLDVLLGALVTSLLFTVGRFLIGFYLTRADYDTLYGNAASSTALLVWVYYSSQIFFFGAAFTKVFADTFGSQRG
jgi:membrane protein